MKFNESVQISCLQVVGYVASLVLCELRCRCLFAPNPPHHLATIPLCLSWMRALYMCVLYALRRVVRLPRGTTGPCPIRFRYGMHTNAHECTLMRANAH